MPLAYRQIVQTVGPIPNRFVWLPGQEGFWSSHFFVAPTEGFLAVGSAGWVPEHFWVRVVFFFPRNHPDCLGFEARDFLFKAQVHFKVVTT